MEFTLEQLKEIVATSVSKAVAEQWEAADAKAREAAAAADIDRKHAAGLFEGANGGAEDNTLAHKLAGNEKGLDAARCIKYMLQGNKDPDRAAKLAKAAGHERVAKALAATSFTGGGFMIPPQFSAEVIDLLLPATVVRACGPTVMPMEGSLTLPFLSSGSSAAYVGENQTITASQPAGGQLQLSAKKLAALVPISNDLLRSNNAKADAVIRNNLVRQIAVKEDLTFLRSDGTSGTPKGVRYWVDSANVFAANTTVTVANTTSDLGQCIYLLENANVKFQNPCWVFSPRTKKYLMTARDANSNLVFAPEMRTGTLMGYPFKVSQQIPGNLGAGSDSEVYFVNWVDTVIAESESLMLDLFPGGTYNDGTGLVSGVANDQTVVRAIAEHDFGAQFRGKEIAVATTVRWT